MQDQQPYDIDLLRKRIPEDRSELYLGFAGWQEDFEGLVRSERQQVDEAPSRPVLRTIWDDPENREARVLLEIAARSSAEEALEALVERLSWNQLAQLPEGPDDLGYAAFVHPEGAPPLVYFILGNLCLTVASYGREHMPVLPLAARLDRRLLERPTVERMTISLESERGSAKVGEPVPIQFDLPWQLGEEGFVKLFSLNGTLRLEDDRPVLRGASPGPASVEALAVEPGRETYAGRLEVTIE